MPSPSLNPKAPVFVPNDSTSSLQQATPTRYHLALPTPVSSAQVEFFEVTNTEPGPLLPEFKDLSLGSVPVGGSTSEDFNTTTIPPVYGQYQSSTTTPIIPVLCQPLESFEYFPALPQELEDKIWETSIVPRLVHCRPGGGKPPAILAVCRDSRAIAEKRYIICFVTHHRNGNYAIFVDPALDTVYFKNGLPNMVPMSHVKMFPITVMTPKEELNANKPGREWNIRLWTLGLKHIIVDIDDAAAQFSGGHRKQEMWTKLKKMFPKLDTLGVVCWPKILKHHTLEDLVPVDTNNATHAQISMIRQVTTAHNTLLAAGKFLSFKIDYLQLPKDAFRNEEKRLKKKDRPSGTGARRYGYVPPHRRRCVRGSGNGRAF